MEKKMYYAVEANGNKYLYSSKPIRAKDYGIWVEGVIIDSETLNVTDTYETMGLPDMTWDDEPLEVKLICVNI